MSKKLGTISYVNHSGLGSIAASFRKHLPLSSQFIIKHPIKDAAGETYDIGIPHTFGDLAPTIDQLNEYLDTCKPEVVIVVETPFNFDFFKIMYDRGIKVVLIPMIDSIGVEKFIPYEKYIDLVINFTKVGHKIYLDKWPGCGIHLSYPIDTEYFSPSTVKIPRNNRPTSFLVDGIESSPGDDFTFDEVAAAISRKKDTFLHSVGFGGAGVRKGSDIIQTAFRQLEFQGYKGKISINIYSQVGELSHNPLQRPQGEEYIQLSNVPDAIDLYRGGKIYIAPSRREGLGLPILEAMACGLPVITTDASPMNEWFSEDYPLLVKVQCQTDLPYGDVPMYTPNAYDLMEKMEFAYKNPELMEQLGETNRIIIQEKFSWDVLRDTYLEFLNR